MLYLFLLQLKKSIYGGPGVDTVVVQDTNSFEILEKITAPGKFDRKYINDSIFDGKGRSTIKEDEYPWPGHPTKLGFTALNDEGTKINTNFCMLLPEDRREQKHCAIHPAGPRQFLGDLTKVLEADRFKFRVFINTRYGYYHWTGIYLPPGQLITIEVPTKNVQTIQAKINRHTTASEVGQTRLPQLSCDITLEPGTNYITWPYGGILEFTVPLHSFDKGLEIIVTGGLKVPVFVFGKHTDEDFYNQLKNNPCPLALLDNGQMKMVVPTATIGTDLRLNDNMVYWRGVGQILSSIKDLMYYPRGAYGNVMIPLQISIDETQNSEAHPGYNIIQLKMDQTNNLLNYEANKWDIVGFYGNHFADEWGVIEDEIEWAKIANKIFGHIIRSKLEIYDAKRQIDSFGNYYDGNISLNHFYQTIDSDAIEWFYENPRHVFGLTAQRQLLHDHINQTYFKRINFDYLSELLLHSCRQFQQDMRPYFKSFKSINMKIPGNVDELVNKMRLQEYHPVCNIYQCGYYINNQEVITSQPFQIPARRCYVFNFTKYMKSRPGMHQFAFDDIDNKTAGTKGTLIQVGKKEDGLYQYMPHPNNTDIDTFYVSYKDTTSILSGKTIVVVKIKQVFNGAIARYMKMSDNKKDIFDAYRELIGNKDNIINPPMMKYDDTKLGNDIPEKNWIGYVDVKFYPPESGKFKFITTNNATSLLYVSTEKFTDNVETDGKSLVMKLERDYNTKEIINQMKFKEYTKDTPIYIRLVALSDGAAGDYSEIQYIKEGGDSKPLPMDRVYFPCSVLSDKDKNPFIPSYEQEANLSVYRDIANADYDDTNFTYKNTTGYALDVDFGKYITFDRIYSTDWYTIGNKAAGILLDGHNIFNRNINEKEGYIIFNSVYTARNLKINIVNEPNFHDHKSMKIYPQMFIGNARTIIPATHSKIIKKGNVTFTDAGLYYNGKGLHLSKDSSIEFQIKLKTIAADQLSTIGIIGDRDPNNGIFKIYVNGVEKGSCDTSIPSNQEGSTTNRSFLVPLYSLRGLPQSVPINIKILAKGDVVIAGFTAEGEILGNSPSTQTAREVLATESVEDVSCDCQRIILDDPKQNGPEGPKQPLGLIIGLTVALVVVIAITVALVVFFLLKKKKGGDHSTEESSNTASTTTRGEVSYNHYF